MFRCALRLARLPLLGYLSIQTHRFARAEPSDQELWMYETMKRVMFAEKAREVVLPVPRDSTPRVVILYGRRLVSSQDFQSRLNKGTVNAQRLGYEITKLFVDSADEIPALAAELNIPAKELHERLDNQVAVFFVEGKRTVSLPGNVGISEIDSWVEKCVHPSIAPKDLAQYYYLARKVIKNEDSYMLLSVDSTPEELVTLKHYSMVQVHMPLLEVPATLAKDLNLPKGLHLCRMYSRLDGEKDPTKLGMLQYFQYPGDITNSETLYHWVVSARQTTIGYLSDVDKLYPHLVHMHSNGRRSLLVLTSQLNYHSRRYQEMLDALVRLQEEYKHRLVISIVPSDSVAAKLSVVRDKKLKRMRTAEARLVDYNKLVSTEQAGDGTFPVIDCSQNEEKCKDLSETHYVRKTAFKGEEMTYDQLKQFIESSLSGASPQYYEVKPLPLRKAKKLNAANFKKEVLESSEDVLLEIYGKYCPGCRAFAPKFDLFAGEMQEYKGKLKVVKLCSDFNYIPELSEMKPFTPIFWYYKAGKKEHPVKFEGANKVDELREFVKQNASFPVSSPSS